MRLTVRPPRNQQPTPGVQLAAAPLPKLFASDSFWYRKLSPSAVLHPNSATWAANLRSQMTWPSGGSNGGLMWFADTQCGHPAYVVPGDMPRITCWVRNPQNLSTDSHAFELDAILRQGVPVPPDWQPSNCTFDKHVVVVQPATQCMWEMIAARAETDGSVSCSWGGVMLDVAANPGVYQDRYDVTGRLWQAAKWAASGSSLPLAGGAITAEEIQVGVIPHALSMAVGHADLTQHLYPAQRHDGQSTTVPVPEGARFRFPANIDVDAYVAKLRVQSVLTTAQRATVEKSLRAMVIAGRDYGIFVSDQTGGGIAIYFREYSITAGAVRWATVRDGGATVWPFEYHRAMPWDVVQVVDPSVSM